jgi:hypothetical protein
MQIRCLPFSKTNFVYSLHVDHKKSMAPPTNDSTHTRHHNLPQLKLRCLRTGRLTSIAPEIGTEQLYRHWVQLECNLSATWLLHHFRNFPVHARARASCTDKAQENLTSAHRTTIMRPESTMWERRLGSDVRQLRMQLQAMNSNVVPTLCLNEWTLRWHEQLASSPDSWWHSCHGDSELPNVDEQSIVFQNH